MLHIYIPGSWLIKVFLLSALPAYTIYKTRVGLIWEEEGFSWAENDLSSKLANLLSLYLTPSKPMRLKKAPTHFKKPQTLNIKCKRKISQL